jgi:hypothetical protein
MTTIGGDDDDEEEEEEEGDGKGEGSLPITTAARTPSMTMMKKSGSIVEEGGNGDNGLRMMDARSSEGRMSAGRMNASKLFSPVANATTATAAVPSSSTTGNEEVEGREVANPFHNSSSTPSPGVPTESATQKNEEEEEEEYSDDDDEGGGGGSGGGRQMRATVGDASDLMNGFGGAGVGGAGLTSIPAGEEAVSLPSVMPAKEEEDEEEFEGYSDDEEDDEDRPVRRGTVSMLSDSVNIMTGGFGGGGGAGKRGSVRANRP